MKTKFLAFAVLLLFASTVAVRADVDPRMALTDPVCPAGSDGSCGVDGLTFSFFSDAEGGGVTVFLNESGVDWTSLLITAQTSILAADVTATSTQFQNVLVQNVGNLLEIYYSGVSAPGCELDCFTGILSASDQNGFSIDLNDVSGTDHGGWGPGLEFDATANTTPLPTPEPATLTLLGVGIAAMVAKRKLRNQRNEPDTTLVS